MIDYTLVIKVGVKQGVSRYLPILSIFQFVFLNVIDLQKTLHTYAYSHIPEKYIRLCNLCGIFLLLDCISRHICAFFITYSCIYTLLLLHIPEFHIYASFLHICAEIFMNNLHISSFEKICIFFALLCFIFYHNPYISCGIFSI